MKLYNFSRSSASYRVRIVANLKGITYDYASVNLMRGESRQPSYEALNPQGHVPSLEDNGRLIPQSMAICEYLEETHPHPSILPADPLGRAGPRDRIDGGVRDTSYWWRPGAKLPGNAAEC